MSEPGPKLTREQRLAARLRENLRRRKAQAREMDAIDAPEPDVTLPKSPG